MIDFRYHIISIVAVFLALGLGMLIGAGVLARVTETQLEARQKALRSDLDEDRKTIKDLRDKNAQRDALLKALAPRVTRDALLGHQVLFVRAGSSQGWEGAVSDAIKLSGAADAGSIVFTDRWTLQSPKDLELLKATLQTSLDPAHPADDGALFLGQRLSADNGPALVSALKDAGFLNISPPASGVFPAVGADVVVFAGTPGQTWLASFARGSAGHAATLVVAPSTDALGAVDVLRRTSGLPKLLSTFDSAGTDPAGVGSVLALQAATRERGGHFGAAGGLNYIPAQ